MSEFIVPKGTEIWISPVTAGEPNQMPILVNGEPHSMNEDGVTKWQKIGGSDAN